MKLAKISVEHKILITFMSITLNICFGFSKELSQLDGSFEYPLDMFWNLDGSFEYPQRMFWLRNKKNQFYSPFLI